MNKKPSQPPRQGPEEEKKRREAMNRQIRYSVSYLIVSLLALWFFQEFVLKPLAVHATEVPYSDFRAALKAGNITEVTIGTDRLTGKMKSTDSATGKPGVIDFTTVAIPNGDPTLVTDLSAQGVKFSVQPPPSPVGEFLLAYGLPLLLIGAVWYFAFRRTGSSRMGGILGVGKSRATEVRPDQINVTYQDVGGADEAIAELQEIIQFLKTPQDFAQLGGRIPKGVLLVGPPGTGKTLLAKATAGEAGVPFFESSGSEFVEMFVGVGAARVRDTFEQARKAAPAIVFIDEIDAIGQSRSGVMNIGSNDEREQTLNQLLAEIDGFQTSTTAPVIIMAATNRPEVLDQALLRAGRFDRQVAVGNPDLAGRQQILKIHSKNVKLDPDFNLARAARITPGFSGADLANVVNEAALLAARRKASAVTIADFEAAIERIVAGLERKTRVMNEQERTAVAYHESGHALVAELLPNTDPVAKVSIVPRGRGALGYTIQMPIEDRYLMSREELESRIAVMLGGRAAEQVVLGTISTGASDDIQRATELARRMVTEFGMSARLGPVRYSGQQLQFLGSRNEEIIASQETRQTIDEEIQRIITGQYERAQELLRDHIDALHSLTKTLLDCESVDGEAVKRALVETHY